MDVFNKIKSTLTSTVNEIAAALPGNPLLREYDAGDQVASAGPDYLWKIYDGTKKSTKAAVSIFVLEKRQLDQYPRGSRELILEAARKGVTQLTKLRHPRILTVEHAVEESRDSLVFCTEPVFASLGNVLGIKKNIADIPTPLRSFHLHDVEIKYGILQISEGLSFLHGSAKMLHGNLSPESVIINKQGVWKLAGFDFCITNSSTAGGDTKFICRDWDTTIAPPTQPNSCYLAPEIILEKRCDFSSDLFSLGALLYSIYYSGKALLECTHTDVYRVMSRSVDNLRNLSSYDLSKFPSEVVDHEKMLIHPDSTVRPDADQMAKLPYFEDIGVVTLQYLDNILQRDNLQKSQFFKGLSQVLPKLPKRVIMQRILPSLCTEFNNNEMLPFVLPNVLTIAEDTDEKEYKSVIFPPLIPVFKVQTPVQVLLILLQKMDLLLKKTPKDLVQAHLLPMICNALAAPSVRIQELCLTIIPTFAQLLDMPSMKNSIIPKIKKIIWEGGTSSVRINGLVCLGKLLPLVDKWFVQDEIFPILFNMKSREPGILMAILGIFQTTYSHKKLGITKDVLATKVIPFLIPFTVETNLNIQQFNTFMTVIKEMLQRIENDQRSKLEQLSQVKIDDSTENFKKLTKTVNGAPVVNGTGQKNQVGDPFGTGTPLSAKPSISSDVKGPGITRQHLTLEEKQRLAKEKEMQYRMKQQGDLKPAQTYSTENKKKAGPKDLTSTLMMQSNMSPMGNAGMNKKPSPSPMMMNNTSTVNKTPSYMTPMTMQPSYMGSAPSNPPSQYGMMSSNPLNQTQKMNSMGMQGWSSNQSGSLTASSQYQSGSLTASSQKSSLDGLLSMPSQSKGPPMQAMHRPPQPHGMRAPRPMGQTALGGLMGPRPLGQNAFEAANPFMSPTPVSSHPVNQAPKAGNLSKQDLLDFLG